MLDIEIIKWSIEEFKPDGFWLQGDRDGLRLEYPIDTERFEDLLHQGETQMYPMWDLLIYPLLLQRIIEGINKHFAYNPKGFFVSQDGDYIDVCRWKGLDREFFPFNCFTTCDEAKEKAIEYIYKELNK